MISSLLSLGVAAVVCCLCMLVCSGVHHEVVVLMWETLLLFETQQALPMPVASPFVPEKSKKPKTVPVPFDLVTEERGGKRMV